MKILRSAVDFLLSVKAKVQASHEIRQLAKFDTYAERLAREINSAEIRIVKDEAAEQEAATALRQFRAANKRLSERSDGITTAKAALPQEADALKALKKAVNGQLRDTTASINAIHQIIRLEASEILADIRTPLSMFDLFIVEIRRMVSSQQLTGLTDADVAKILADLHDVEEAYARLVESAVRQVNGIHRSYKDYTPELATASRDLDIAQTLNQRTSEKRRLNGFRLAFSQKLDKFRRTTENILDHAVQGTNQQQATRDALKAVTSQLSTIYVENDSFIQQRINVGALVVVQGHQLMISHKQEIIALEHLLQQLTQDAQAQPDALTAQATTFDSQALAQSDTELRTVERDIRDEDGSLAGFGTAVQELLRRAKRALDSLSAIPSSLYKNSSRTLRRVTAIFLIGAMALNTTAGGLPQVMSIPATGGRPDSALIQAQAARMFPGQATDAVVGGTHEETFTYDVTVDLPFTYAPHYRDTDGRLPATEMVSRIEQAARHAQSEAAIAAIERHSKEVNLSDTERNKLIAEIETNPSAVIKNAAVAVTVTGTASLMGADTDRPDVAPTIPGNQSGAAMDTIAAQTRIAIARPSVQKALDEVYGSQGAKTAVTEEVKIVRDGPELAANIARLNAVLFSGAYAQPLDAGKIAAGNQQEINRYGAVMRTLHIKNPHLFEELNGKASEVIRDSVHLQGKGTVNFTTVVYAAIPMDAKPEAYHFFASPEKGIQEHEPPLPIKQKPVTVPRKQGRGIQGWNKT